MKNIKTVTIKTVTIKLTDPVSKQWFTVDVNLDFTERTEPVKSMHLDNSGSTKQWYSAHTWERKDGTIEPYNTLLQEVYENGLNKHLFT